MEEKKEKLYLHINVRMDREVDKQEYLWNYVSSYLGSMGLEYLGTSEYQPQARAFTEFTDKNISDDIPKGFVDIDGKLHKFEYNPEKKEWKKKIPMWIKEDLFEEVTDDRGTRILGYVNCSDRVLDFIEQEIDRAREEGRKAERDRIFRGLDSIDCIKEALPKNYSASGMQFGIYRAKEIVLEKELSKLTTK